ncbi:hypothetical protein KKE60_08860 [Patescibacteria group bacterium]|nr:hypothetical protein [Patescibacteria group bacterium]
MGLKSVLTRINKARDAHIEKQEIDAELELARFKAKAVRETERAKLVAERSLAYAEANKAKAIAFKAEAERKQAERELKGEGFFARVIKELRR